jgi:hypothetical protein
MYPEKCGKPNATICKTRVQIPSTIPDSNGVKKRSKRKSRECKKKVSKFQ